MKMSHNFLPLDTPVPSSAEIRFLLSTDSDFEDLMGQVKGEIEQLVSRLCQVSATVDSGSLASCIPHSSVSPPTGLPPASSSPTAEFITQMRSKSSLFSDLTDELLECTDTLLDSLSIPTSLPAKTVANPSPQKTWVPSSDIPKPQLAFNHPVDNTDYGLTVAWKPILTDKGPHAISPLDLTPQVREPEEDDFSSVATCFIPHPFRPEIEALSLSHQAPGGPSILFNSSEPVFPSSYEETPYGYVETQVQLDEMVRLLKGADLIAVDLEHHSERSFRGFVCLMQISIRGHDWIVDTLKLRLELRVLNQVFTDPAIVKVLHGAESDVVWLQRDFGLYLVNVFDTYHATHALNFPSHSLASLLSMFCSVVPDKRHQMADWRVRPLSAELVEYARGDTHYLPFIFDSLRNALLEVSPAATPASEADEEATKHDSRFDKMLEVLRRSNNTALRLYTPETFDETGYGPGGWRRVLQKWNKRLSSEQQSLFCALYKWRDTVAREEDESPRWVGSNQMLFALVDRRRTGLVTDEIVRKACGYSGNGLGAIMRKKSKSLVKLLNKHVSQIPPSHPSQESSVIAGVKTSDMVPLAMPSPEPVPSPAKVFDDDFWGTEIIVLPNTTAKFPSSTSVAPDSKLFGAGLWEFGETPADSQNLPIPSTSKSNNHDSDLENRLLAVQKSISDTLAIKNEKFVEAPSSGEEAVVMINVSEPLASPKSTQSRELDRTFSDDIILIGRPKEKRKPERSQEEKAARKKLAKSSQSSKPDLQNIVPFDYSSVKSVLDQPEKLKLSGRERLKSDEKKRKEKKSPQNKRDGNDFGPTPRNLAERGTTRSMTFRG